MTIGERVVIDEKALPSSRIFAADAEGRTMPVYAGGTIPQGSVFLHSEFVGSYDSRYFGPHRNEGQNQIVAEATAHVGSHMQCPS